MKRFALVFGWLALATVGLAQNAPLKQVGTPQPGVPPRAPVRPVTTTYYGVKVTDPYGYMQDLKDPTVQAWISAQGDYARATLDRISGRAKLLAEVTKLDESDPAQVSQMEMLPGDEFFYLKKLATEDTYKLYRRDGLDGKDVALVDPLAFNEPGRAAAIIDYFAPSPDGNYVVYGITRGGTGITTLHVVDARTGEPLPDVIGQVRYPVARWLPDGHSFLYSRMLPSATGAGAKAKAPGEASGVYLHELGTDPAEDLAVFGAGVAGSPAVPAGDVAWIDMAPGSKFALGVVESGTDHTLTLYAAPLSDVGTPDARWRRVGNDQTHILDYSVGGDNAYLLVAGSAGPAIAKVSLANPSVGNWALMLQLPRDAGISGVQAASDALYISDSEGGLISLVRIPYSAAAEIVKVELPFTGDVHLYEEDSRATGALVLLSSWTRAPAIYRYDSKTDRMTPTNLWPAGPYDDPKNIVATNVSALGANGTLVPLTILYKEGIERDGANPTLLVGYGAQSIPMAPAFSPLWRVWLDRGGVLAFAQVRGSGAFGGFWRFEGSRVGLADRYREFLTCAQYLINQGYTNPNRLAALSGSAGGILAGGAITAQPGLFRAAIIESGLLDLVRYHETAESVLDLPNEARSASLGGFEALYSASAYDHVEPGVRYPAVLLAVGMNDARVDPWQSAKMAARLEADSTSGLPVLLRIDRNVGHSLASTAEQQRRLFTDEMSFLFWQLGVPGFQPGSVPAESGSVQP